MSLRKSWSASVVISPWAAGASGSPSALVGLHDLDLRLVERRVELVQLTGVEAQLVERDRNLVGIEPSGLLTALEQALRFIRLEHLFDRCSTCPALWFGRGQPPPFVARPSHGSHGSGQRQRNPQELAGLIVRRKRGASRAMGETGRAVEATPKRRRAPRTCLRSCALDGLQIAGCLASER